MKCKKCGAELKEGVAFCRECGAKVEDEEAFSSNDEYRLENESNQNSTGIEKDYVINKSFSKQNDKKPNQKSHQKTMWNIIKNWIVGQWKRMDLFLKICSVLILLSFLLFLLAVYKHIFIAFVLSIVQLLIVTYSIFSHKGEIENKKPWVKYVLVVVCILSIFLDSNLLLKSNKSTISGNMVIPTINKDSKTDENEGIYSYEIRNYIGMNVASIGENKNNELVDKYGAGYLSIILVNNDGTFIDINDKEELKEYVVLSQSIKPNDPFINVMRRDSDWKPYTSLVSYQNYQEIVLYVGKVNQEDNSGVVLTEINPVLDRHNYFIKDYVGRNLASFGETISGKRVDHYGVGEINLVFVTEDGEYIDSNSLSDLRQYYVEKQNVPANTELKYIYKTDSDGIEYNSLLKSQSIEEITLYVKKLDDSILSLYKEINENVNSSNDSDTTQNLGPDEIRIGESSSSFLFMNYIDVKNILEKEGFTNIETEIVYDIVFGITKEGEFAKISIDGEEDFEEGDIFKKDARIIITYHMKAKDDPNKKDDDTPDPSGNGSSTDKETVSYYSGTKDTVKDGDSGVYAYRNIGGSYYCYYIIDLDEGYVYFFTDGNGSETCDKVEITSGNLNDVVIITYHDGSDVWQEGLHFKWCRQPDHLIWESSSHFEYDFYTTDLNSAKSIMSTKTIIEY